MHTPRLSVLELLTPDHHCGVAFEGRRGLCWHLYGRRGDGGPFAVATHAESSIGAQVRVRAEIEGAFFERVVIGAAERQPVPHADYR